MGLVILIFVVWYFVNCDSSFGICVVLIVGIVVFMLICLCSGVGCLCYVKLIVVVSYVVVFMLLYLMNGENLV